MPCITLTTDFGTRDWFVGAMKGVILGLNPVAKIIDLTHDIPPGDIRAGAFALAASCRFFPKHTIHLAVVDPGVGSGRGAIVIRTRNHTFVGPDNGLLSWAAAKENIQAIRSLENERYFIRPISRTFHGRDIFAPVAAHLSCGLPLHRLGPAQKGYVRLKWPVPRRSRAGFEGEVIYIDGFGNAITTLGNSLAPGGSRGVIEIRVKRPRVCSLEACYEAARAGELVAVPGSSGLIEIAVNGGSAQEATRLTVGTKVLLRAPRE